MTKNVDNDLNFDLGNQMLEVSLAQNVKRTIKKMYLERCEMEEKKVGSVTDLVTSLFLVVQSALKNDCGEDSNVVAVSSDAQQFGLDFITQFVLCANGSTYRRMVSANGCSKFVCTNKKEDEK